MAGFMVAVGRRTKRVATKKLVVFSPEGFVVGCACYAWKRGSDCYHGREAAKNEYGV